jgi:NADH-quinone oxidoreductase subunit I
MGIFKDIKNLLIGMKITSKHLTRHAVTVQYPEQRDDIPPRSRGIVVLLSDKETGALNCTACELCMKVCPTAAIKIVAPRGDDKKKHLESFEVNNTLCCFCGLCQDVCNFAAIKMATMYEFSTLDKSDLIWDMNKLQEVGRDVPYTPKPKKKPVVKKPAVATDAAAPEKTTSDSEKPAETPVEKPEAPAPEKPKAETEKQEETIETKEEPPQDEKGEV